MESIYSSESAYKNNQKEFFKTLREENLILVNNMANTMMQSNNYLLYEFFNNMHGLMDDFFNKQRQANFEFINYFFERYDNYGQ